jgi:hypothetical protein
LNVPVGIRGVNLLADADEGRDIVTARLQSFQSSNEGGVNDEHGHSCRYSAIVEEGERGFYFGKECV